MRPVPNADITAQIFQKWKSASVSNTSPNSLLLIHPAIEHQERHKMNTDDITGPFDEQPQSSFQRMISSAKKEAEDATQTAIHIWNKQPLWGKFLIVLTCCLAGVAGVMFLVYHEYLLHLIVEYSDKWAEISWMPFVLMGLLFIISFPPVIGFSFVNTVTGAVYGISFKGWFIIAFGSIVGSMASFLLFKFTLRKKAESLVRSNQKLYAFSSVLQDNNSFWLLTLIRVCPFPYSLTNGALAAIPGVTLLNFFLGSLISSPKLVMYLFVGQKLKDIGRTTDTWTRVTDVLSIVLTMGVLTFTGWLLFTRTSNRLREIETNGGAIHTTGPDDLERHLRDDYDDSMSLHTQEERSYSDDFI